jgi:hypothetical protein
MPRLVHPFGNLAAIAARDGLRQAHGFASPPFDGFTVSRMERFPSRFLWGERCFLRGDRRNILLCSEANLVQTRRPVKPDNPKMWYFQ